MSRRSPSNLLPAVSILAFVWLLGGDTATIACPPTVLEIIHEVTIPARISSTSPSLLKIDPPSASLIDDVRTVDVRIKVPVKSGTFIDYRSLNFKWQPFVMDDNDADSLPSLFVTSLERFTWVGVTIVVTQPCN